MKRRYKQRGENPEWPITLEGLWKYGESIPEWLSDRANVTIMSGDGIKNIEIRETSTPPTRTFPDDGLSSLYNNFIKVDLPAPLEPTKNTNSPLFI